MTYVSLNWCPKTFGEFYGAASSGLVRLNIHHDHYIWLYENIMPWKPWLYLLGFGSYEERLFRKMMSNEETFWKVHKMGIDLVLSEPTK